MKPATHFAIRFAILLTIFSCQYYQISAQMWNGVDTLYGNEWIDYSKPHFKIKSAETGVHRLSATTLSNAGFPLSSVQAADYRLFKNGIEIPIYISTSGNLNTSDFIEFIGKKNTSEVDRFLFDDADNEMVNPWYSMYTDSAAYFLTYRTTGQGKRFASIPNDLTNLPSAAPFCWFENRYFISNTTIKRKFGQYISNSWLDGDGFGGTNLFADVLPIPSPQIYTNGPAARYSLRYFADQGAHNIKTTINDSIYAIESFNQFRIVQQSFDVPIAALKTNNVARFDDLDATTSVRFNAVGGTLRYPRLFDFENAPSVSFTLPISATSQYIEINRIDAQTGVLPLVFDETNLVRLEATVENNIVKVKLPPSNVERTITISNGANGSFTVASVQNINFRNLPQENTNFLFIAAASLRQGANGDPVQAYADYRSSAAGGNYDPMVVNVQELYDQFAYGLDYHAISIRNFCHFAKKQWPNTKHVLLFGKALEYDGFRSNAQHSTLKDSLFFVPTIGKPGSDWVFVMPNHLEKPIMSIGRIAARRPSDIKNYLDKIIEQEANQNRAQTVEDRAWMKRFLHISGGTTPSEQFSLRASLKQMEQTTRTSRVGGTVTALDKDSNDPVLLSGAARIRQLANEGLAMITMFGHGAVNVLDYDFGKASEFTNKGKYPFFMAMGCFSGNCSTPVTSVGEDFTLAKDRGTIAFFATSNPGYVHALNTFGNQFYRTLGGGEYGKTVGEVISAAIDSLSTVTDPATIGLIHQMVLQGDPAYTLNMSYGADYTIDKASFKTNPSLASAELDSLMLHFDLYNLGENKGGMVDIKVEQRFPNDSLKTIQTISVPAPAYKNSIDLTLPPPGVVANGKNRLFVQLDSDNLIAELPTIGAEANNDMVDGSGQKGTDVFYFLDDILPLYPTAFSIVSTSNLELIAGTYAPKTANKRFLFQIDTTSLFNSSFRKDTAIWQEGGLLSWKPNAGLLDNTVYYWRVSVDSLSNGLLPWHTSSFLNKSNSDKGWNQSHYYQYEENQGFNINLNPQNRKFEFVDNAAYTFVQVGYYNAPLRIGFYNNWFEGYTGTWEWYLRGINQGILVALTNPVDGHLVLSPPGAPYNFDQDSTRSNIYFYFDTRDSLSRINMMNFLDNEVPDNYVVSLLSYVKLAEPMALGTDAWAMDSVSFGKNIYQVLENKGATKIRQLETLGSVPYALIYHNKNSDFPILEKIVTKTDTTEEIRSNFLAKWTAGFLQTPKVGPVSAWNRLEWSIEPLDEPNEIVSLEIIATRDGKPDSVLVQLNSQQTSYDLTGLSAASFPSLYLKLSSIDTFLHTPPQLNYLRIYYDGLPEGSVDLSQGFTLVSDTLQQGEDASLQFYFKNISDKPMDSLLIRLNITNAANQTQVIDKRFVGLEPFKSLQPTFAWNTRTSAGQHNLTVEVNPSSDQAERYHFNNFFYTKNLVEGDNTNPLLDVTFDGVKILNEDLVSPKPLIRISLEDESSFFLLSDTSTFFVEITSPSGVRKTFTHNDPAVIFFPAQSGKNKAELELRPTFTEDGIYTLIVNGKDAAGNDAGNSNYSVKFQVITKSSLSSLINYPNPFSTSTCFFYTMTGLELPAQFKMQIMTVSGRVVREILGDEFGPLLPGAHKSEFCWDGHDSFGDQLANGVYLYRVFAKKSDGSDFELFVNDKTAAYFNHGIGKMVLMR